MATNLHPDDALHRLKAALGLPPELLVQAIVLECRAGILPRVYVKGLVTRQVIDAAAGVLEILPVADVTVDDRGEVRAELP